MDVFEDAVSCEKCGYLSDYSRIMWIKQKDNNERVKLKQLLRYGADSKVD